jgi:hypothetical protein
VTKIHFSPLSDLCIHPLMGGADGKISIRIFVVLNTGTGNYAFNPTSIFKSEKRGFPAGSQ